VVRTSHSRGLRPRWCGLGLTLCLSLVLAACSPADEGPAGAVPTAPVATTAPTEEPTEEPLSLTVEEANEILAELSRIQGDIFRLMIATGEVPPEAYERLEAAFTGPALESGRTALQQFLENDPEAEHLLGGDPIRMVLSIHDAGPSCVAVQIEQDLSGAIDGSPLRVGITALVPGPSDEFNDSGWRIGREYLGDSEADLEGDPCDDVA
jgi:hypothetical protein